MAKSFVRQGKTCYRSCITLTFAAPPTIAQSYYIIAQELNGYKTFMDWVFYPELGVAHDRLHYHGTIYYSNALHFNTFLTRWRRNHGFYSISKQGNYIGWHIYCRKEQHTFHGLRPPRLNYHNRHYVMKKYSPFPNKTYFIK